MLSLQAFTICTRVQVDLHISRPCFLAVKNVQNSRPTHKSTPVVYRLVSDVADAINSVSHDAVVRKVARILQRD